MGWETAPDYPYTENTMSRYKMLARMVCEKNPNASGLGWVPRESPANASLCVMLKHGYANHVGIWVDGVVFHAVEGRGVIGTTLQKTMTLGYDKVEFYDHEEMPWL